MAGDPIDEELVSDFNAVSQCETLFFRWTYPKLATAFLVCDRLEAGDTVRLILRRFSIRLKTAT
jgi:hypothetical protein